MDNSNHLLEIIESIWKKIASLYYGGEIYSERDLQAHFFRLFYSYIELFPKYKIWVEPSVFYFEDMKDIDLEAKGDKSFKPDILITENDIIKIWIEFKFGGAGGSDQEKFEKIYSRQNIEKAFKLYPVNLTTMDLQPKYKYYNEANSITTIVGRISNGRSWLKNINKTHCQYALVGEVTARKFELV